MVENKTFGSRLFDVINVIILAILAISCLYPLWYTLCVSISNKSAVASGQVTSVSYTHLTLPTTY